MSTLMKTAARHLTLAAMFCAAMIALNQSAKAAVVTYIDLFNTSQSLTTNSSTVSSTVASLGAVGGYRTLTLDASYPGVPPEFPQNSQASVSAVSKRFTLSSPAEAISLYEIKWGGAGGTAGLGGIDFRGGIAPIDFSLNASTLNFALRSADQLSSFTWTFTDTLSNVATYSGNFPAHSSLNPAIPYAISLASFSGAGIIDWSSINFITLSGGGLELDLVMPAPFSVTAQPIPEPGTWAAAGLLVLAAGYIRWRRSRSATAEDAPAAA